MMDDDDGVADRRGPRERLQLEFTGESSRPWSRGGSSL